MQQRLGVCWLGRGHLEILGPRLDDAHDDVHDDAHDFSVSNLYFMKNTGNITNTQHIEFKCENPTNNDIDIIYVQNAIVLKTMRQLIFHDW